MAAFASAVGGVERERAWLERWHVYAAVYTSHALGIELLLAIDDGYEHRSSSELQSVTNGVRKAIVNPRLDQQAIYKRFNRVVAASIQPDLFIQRKQIAINARPQETLFRKFLEFLFKLSLPASH